MIENLLTMKGVSLERLLALSEIAAKGGIVSAAGGDSARQSLMSRQVKELEQALGITLLDRRKKPRAVTEEGHRLVRCVRAFATEFESEVRRETGEPEVVRIGAGESVLLWVLLPLFSKTLGKLNLQFEFCNMRSQEAVEALSAGVIDIALYNMAQKRQGLECREVARYGMKLVAQPGLISGKRVVSWCKLSALPVAHVSGGGTTESLVEEQVEKYQEGPYQWMRCTSHHQVLEMCRLEKILGVVPGIAAQRAKAMGLEVRTVRDFSQETYSLAASWQKKRAENSEAFRALLVLMCH